MSAVQTRFRCRASAFHGWLVTHEVNAQSGPLAEIGKLRHRSGATTAQAPEEWRREVLCRGAEGRGPDPRPWSPPGQQGELGRASTSLSLAGNGAMTVL